MRKTHEWHDRSIAQSEDCALQQYREPAAAVIDVLPVECLFMFILYYFVVFVCVDDAKMVILGECEKVTQLGAEP